MLQLLVLPKNGHTCDTTVVELVIAQWDGPAVWDLTCDVVGDLLQGNPHADRLGNRDVWHFCDMADSTRGGRDGFRAGLADWDRTAAAVADGQRDRTELARAARRFQHDFALTDARSPFWIRRRANEKHLPPEGREILTRLAAELDGLKRNPPPPVAYANGAQEGGVPGSPHAGVHDVRVHVRGRYDRLGDLVSRQFPQVLAGTDQLPIRQGSGRLQLAKWLIRPDNPLTARVMVNRIWQHHFGEGLVRTPSNFGKLGERPSHPELLDYLARLFVDGGWSVKQMHREILLSATYQQASTQSAEDLQRDPDNRLFGRMNRRRLEAEAIRDSLLAVAGRLDRTRGGPATRDFNNPRRTLYQMTVRSDRTGFGPLFDVADSTAPVEKRTVSTVAPQALFLMNHPFVLEQTRALARRILGAVADSPGRIRLGYTLLYARAPSDQELEVGLEFLAQDAFLPRAWEAYFQILLCANEFLYVD
jgi:hypothetical protein